MSDEKVQAEDIEQGDIIWVDRKNAYCEVLDIAFSMSGKIVFTMKQTGGGEPSEPNPRKVFTKGFKFEKEVRLFT